MISKNLLFTFIILTFFLFPSPQTFAENSKKTQEYKNFSEIPEYLRSKISSHMFREQYIVNVLGDLRRFDPNDGNSITEKKITEKEETFSKQAIRNQIKQTLEYDIDIDGKVSLEEVETTLSNKYENSKAGLQRKKEITEQIMELDTNNDKIISFKEMATLNKKKHSKNTEHHLARYRNILALAPNQTEISYIELEELAIKAFNTVDKDRNSKISNSEYKPFKTKMDSIRANYMHPYASKSKDKCIFPELEENSSLINVHLYSGQAISSVTTAGQSSETTSVDVDIAEDMKPTYLILSSHRPNIYNFSRDSDNLKNLVVYNRMADENGKSTVGIVGIPKEKITFLDGHCLPPYNYSSGMGELSMKAAISKALGRKPDKMYGEERYEKIEISSQGVNLVKTKVGPYEKIEVPKGYDPQVWSRHTTYFPAGVREINAKKVVSVGKAEKYEILPHSAGIAQLVNQGKMEIVKLGTYKILENLPRYPAGLGGGHAVNFIIAKGVTPPAGQAGHSCVRLEETGEAIAGPRGSCR